jgi:hypothetical protein
VIDSFSPPDPFALQIQDNFATFIVSEARESHRDLNGDGDAEDFLLHIADLSTLTTLSTGLSGPFAYRALQSPVFPASEGRVVVPMSEARQGNRDLNGDGDTQDIVLQSLDTRTGRARNTGVAVAADRLGFFTRFVVPLALLGNARRASGWLGPRRRRRDLLSCGAIQMLES